jgi:hypothetical protein
MIIESRRRYSSTLLRTSLQPALKQEDVRQARAERRRAIRLSSSYLSGLQDLALGTIVPSDVVFVEQFLSDDSTHDFDLNQVFLYSDQDRQFCTKTHTFRITYRHMLRYKGEIVWKLETVCHGSGQGIRGESSMCRLYKTHLRVRIRHKTTDLWVGSGPTSSTIDQQSIPLRDILLRSADKYQSEASFSSGEDSLIY